jgi:hypothetical protein
VPKDGGVVLAPATARRLQAHVGSIVPLSGDRATRLFRVSGIGFGVQTSTSSYDSGAWVSSAAYDQLFRGFQEHGGLIALRAGARPEVVLPRIQRRASIAAGHPDVLVITPFVPAQLAQIRDVRTLPVGLGYLLIGFAVGGVGQTLAAAVRSRTREIAVLRALGMTSRQSRRVVRTQAIVFGTIALLAGIPLGLALGRILWRWTAEFMPLQYRPPLPSTALLLVGPAVFAAALLLAAMPARRAARLRIADALRAE